MASRRHAIPADAELSTDEAASTLNQIASRLRIPTLIRALRAPDAELSKDEAASTIYRFFRSQHVRDLRTILAWATLLLAGFAPVIVGLGILDSITAASDKPHHFEIAWRVLEGTKFLLTYVSPAIGIYGAVWAWAYLSASARLGIVDLFASEISTLCRVGTIFDIGKLYVELTKMDEPRKGANTFVSKEDYFPIFDSNSKELQVLESSIVTHITAFYTYMKAVRDTLRKLAQTEPSQGADSSPKTSGAHAVNPWRAAVSDVIFMLFLGYESARQAIDDLIEYQPTAAENKMVILITELKCYSYLLDYYKDDQLRKARLDERRLQYKKDTFELCRMVFDKKDNADWNLAVLTLGELKRRYAETFREQFPEGFPTDDEIESAAQDALGRPRSP